MIPVLRKVVHLNIKHRKNGGPIIDVCTGAPPDDVTALLEVVNVAVMLSIWWWNSLVLRQLYEEDQRRRPSWIPILMPKQCAEESCFFAYCFFVATIDKRLV